MNFDNVIAAHSAWKGRLHAFLEGKEQLDAATVCRDDACALGIWIYNEGAKFQAEPMFATVKSDHKAFHQCAADVVALAKRGDKAGAQKALAFGSKFAALSSKLVSAVSALRKKVEHA
jgi:Chemoreceptor zinc-binding domain